MGRKTYESIGKALPGRTTLILSRNPGYRAEDCITVSSFEKAVAAAEKAGEKELFICGGAQIYRELLDKADKFYISFVDYNGDADVYFPDYSSISLKQVEEKTFHTAGKSLSWTYKVLEKK